MATLTAKTTMNPVISYTNINKKGLWMRFRNYLTENKLTIIAGMVLMDISSYYTNLRIPNR